MEGEGIRIRTLLGDTTHHVGTALQKQTNQSLALHQLAPLQRLIDTQEEPTEVLAGNTDSSLAANNPQGKETWFAHTGFQRDHIVFPDGGLWTQHGVGITGQTHTRLLITHGHALDAAQRGEEFAEHKRLMYELFDPSDVFLETIASITGAHADKTRQIGRIGRITRAVPLTILRKWIAEMGAKRLKTQHFGTEFAKLIDVTSTQMHISENIYGVMGHLHTAGIRKYGDSKQTVINTGTFGARNIPLERVADRTSTMFVVEPDTQIGQLVQTYDPRHPDAKPKVLQSIDLNTGNIF